MKPEGSMRRRVLGIIILLCFVTSFVHGQEKEEKQEAGSGKRSTIVEVDGYAYIAEDKTISQLREDALANAKREALERASTYVESMTKVENFQLTYDVIQSQAAGTVQVLESKDHGVTDDNRYHYWIKAEVEYSLAPAGNKADLSADLVKDVNAPLTVHVWTEKPEYLAGQSIKIFVQGNKDFYARVVYRDVQGNLAQLLPNPMRKDNFFPGGKVITIPSGADQFDLEVGPPFGTETIIVYASSSEIGDADMENMGDVVYAVKDNLEDLGVKTRGVKIVKKKEETSVAGAEFYEARCSLKTSMQ